MKNLQTEIVLWGLAFWLAALIAIVILEVQLMCERRKQKTISNLRKWRERDQEKRTKDDLLRG
jgi:hypothetical protein